MKLDLKELISKLTNTPMIVESGTSGIWTYRKWSNGIAECWGTYTSGSVSATAVNGWYYGVISTNFPFTFMNVPVCVASGKWDTGVSWITARDVAVGSVTMHAVKNGTGAAAVSARIYAIGTWK